MNEADSRADVVDGTAPLSDSMAPDSAVPCTVGTAHIPFFHVEAQSTPASYDGPAVVTEADSTHLAIQPSLGNDAAQPLVRVTFYSWTPGVLPALGDRVWVTLRDATPSYSGFLFAAVRKTQGGELYFAYLDDTLDLYNAGYFSTPDAAGAALSVSDGCSENVKNGCFDQEKNTQLRLRFKADTTLTLGGKEAGRLWTGGKLYEVFVDSALRIEGSGTSHCTDTSTGSFVHFFLVQQSSGVAACLAKGYPCTLCCNKYVDPNSSFYATVRDCACADPGGACRSECSNANSFFCANASAQYKPCIDCLDNLALSPPAACANAMTACAQSSPCAAYAGCLKSCSGD